MAINLDNYKLSNNLDKYKLPDNTTKTGFITGEPKEVHQSFMQKLGGAIVSPLNNVFNPVKAIPTIKDAFMGGVNQVKQGFQQADNTNGNPLDLVRGVGNIGAGVVGSLFSPLAPAMNEVIGKPMNAVADKLADTSAFKDPNSAYLDNPTPYSKPGDVSSSNPYNKIAGGAENVANYSTITGTIGGFMEPHIQGAVKEVPSTLKGIPSDMTQGLENKYVQQVKSEWSKPTTIAKPAYNNATEIFKNAKSDIIDTLVKNKLNPSDHIENGTYSTADTANKIRTDAIKASNEILRPSLVKADVMGAPKTPVSDVVDSAISNVARNKTLTAETKANIIDSLEKTQSALEKQHPDGMSLTDLHDEKIVRDLNSKYDNVTNNPATNAEAVKNKAIADASRKTLQVKAPKDIPVEDFNAELAKQHQAANYLDALNNKKAPVGIGTKIARSAAKVAGATVGNMFGGGILGGVGGYHIGGLVESMFENMSNPVKNAFLKNLEITNPEAFTKVQEYLNTNHQLLLPEPKAGMPKASVNIPIEQPTKIQPLESNSSIGRREVNTSRLLPSPSGRATGDYTKTINLPSKIITNEAVTPKENTIIKNGAVAKRSTGAYKVKVNKK